MRLGNAQIGKRLFVGCGKPEALGKGSSEVRGSAYVEGPLQVGRDTEYDRIEATVMIAEEFNPDSEQYVTQTVLQQEMGESDKKSPAKLSLKVKGNTDIIGDDKTPDALYVTSGKTHAAKFVGAGDGGGQNCVYIEGDLYVTGAIDGGNKGRLASRFGTADGLGKVFDIPHPTKGKGHRLAHACIEGPEVAVYYRGRCKNSNEIRLPSYWKDLVHSDSITVQLQPVGAHQDIIIKRWDDEKVYLQAKGGMPIDCFYHVYAERKDINPLHVEYKGETWEDYPDPNHRNFDPLDPKRNLLDEKYRGPRNTVTM